MAQGLAVVLEDAVIHLGQVEGDGGQIYLADDVFELIDVHPRILYTTQGDVKFEIGLEDAALGFEKAPDVLDQCQEILRGIGRGEVDDLAMGTRGKGVERVEGDGGGHGLAQNAVQTGHEIHTVGGKVQEGHRDVVIVALPAYVDAAQQVAQLPKPILVKGDGHFYFEISFHRLIGALLLDQITKFLNVITKILIKVPITHRCTNNRANETSCSFRNARPVIC